MKSRAPIVAREDDDVRFTYCIRCKINKSREGLCRECMGRDIRIRVGREPCYKEGCHEMRFKNSIGCKIHAYNEEREKTRGGRWADWKRRRAQRLAGTSSANC